MKRAQDSGQVMEEERVNGREMFAAMSRQEKTAWLLLAAFGLSAGLVGWRLFFSDAALEKNVVYPAWYLFWTGYFFFIRKDRTVAADERDRIIQAHGVRAGYTALALMLVVVSVLAEGYGEFVASRTGYWLANFLVWLVCLSVSLHAAVMVWHYWRDRR